MHDPEHHRNRTSGLTMQEGLTLHVDSRRSAEFRWVEIGRIAPGGRRSVNTAAAAGAAYRGGAAYSAAILQKASDYELLRLLHLYSIEKV